MSNVEQIQPAKVKNPVMHIQENQAELAVQVSGDFQNGERLYHGRKVAYRLSLIANC